MIEQFLEEVNLEGGTSFQLIHKETKNDHVRFTCQDPECGKIEGFVESEKFGESRDRQLRRLFARHLPPKTSPPDTLAKPWQPFPEVTKATAKDWLPLQAIRKPRHQEFQLPLDRHEVLF